MTSDMLPYRRIQLIINPTAGQDKPILGAINNVFAPAGIDWEVSITKKAGDGIEFARQAIAAGVDAIAVYGGDGTVMEVASGVRGTSTPLAIIPGGTANVMSVELGIPNDVTQAASLLVSNSVPRWVDMGQVGEDYFLLRVGIGFEAQMVEGAPRELKDRIGTLAYAFSALQALRDPQIARYRLTLDGLVVETEGMTCMVANAGNLGVQGLLIAPQVDVSDGLLDVVVIRSADLPALLSVAASVMRGDTKAEPLLHWQAREVRVEADPPQSVQVDGEILPPTPVQARIVPRALQIIVPAPAPPPTA